MLKLPGQLLWLDVETTGLDRDTDRLLEVGAVVTDAFLNPVDQLNMVMHLDAPAWASLTRSGPRRSCTPGSPSRRRGTT